MTQAPAVRLDRESIVEAAGRLIDEVGPDELSMTRVAEELGVTQPALYRHVEGVGELWRLMGVSTRTMLADRLVRATGGLATDDAVRALAVAWRRFSLGHPGRYRAADGHAVAGDPELEEAARTTIGVIEQALAGYDLLDRRRHFSATAIRSALHGFCVHELSDGNPDRDEKDLAFDAMVDLLIAGLRAIEADSTS